MCDQEAPHLAIARDTPCDFSHTPLSNDLHKSHGPLHVLCVSMSGMTSQVLRIMFGRHRTSRTSRPLVLVLDLFDRGPQSSLINQALLWH